MAQHSLELLAPAGGMDAFRAALAAGADAIFCGVGSEFNARRGAGNFDLASFAEACRMAHLAGARVYVTTNIVIKQSELDAALGLVRDAYLAGADAFIVQDWGLVQLIGQELPQAEVHLSTQANVHDRRGVAFARAAGVTRVTTSREITLAEAAALAQEGTEIEVFGHGALCYCYSGLCLMSSMAGGRSGNRGLCAQPCRLPWDLVDERGQVLNAPDRGRPLCPKDCNTYDDLAALRAAGVASLKVEGRLKAPDYIWSVITAYRGALDALEGQAAPTGTTAAGRPAPASPQEADEARRRLLARAFNRSFTDAYLQGTSGDEMMSYERSNNRGQLVGAVVASRALPAVRVERGGKDGGRKRTRKQTRAEVDIRLFEPVGAGDLLEVRPEADPSQFLTCLAREDAPAGALITCSCARPMGEGDPVRLIRSQAAMDAAARTTGLDVPRARPVRVRVVARLGEPFVVELSCADGSASARAQGFCVEPARTVAVDAAQLEEHVGRMGGSPFVPVSFSVELDEGCGMGFSAVHKVRAQAVAALEQAILAPWDARRAAVPQLGQLAVAPRQAAVPAPRQAAAPAPAQPLVCVVAPNSAVAHAAVAAGATRVYATADALAAEPPEAWPAGTVPALDEVSREVDRARLDSWVHAGQPVAVGNVSGLALAAERGAQAELRPTIPVHNSVCLDFFERAGAQAVWLSPELSLEEIEELAPFARVPLGLVVAGRPRVMTAEHCTLQVADRCVHDCARCGLRMRDLALRDHEGRRLPVRTDLQGRARIYAAEPLDAVPELPRLLAAGLRLFAVDATLLDADEAARAVARLVRALRAAQAGERMPARARSCGSGHLHHPIR